MNVVLWSSVSIIAFWTNQDDVKISEAAKDDRGFLIHEVESHYQAGQTQIRVLLPDVVDPGHVHRVIYVLPVEARNGFRYGDGLAEVRKHDLHNKHRLIFVAPTFSELPWYADHATDQSVQQEAFFLKVVVPFVERAYPVQSDRAARLLLGFSKSGWGAWSLLLRNPEMFSRAAAWDAPLTMDRLGSYGTQPIFGTTENFERYRVTSLLTARAKLMGNEKRLILTGYGNFRGNHEQIHSLLNDIGIPHEYRDGPGREHNWHSGWVPEAVELLVSRE